jgi:hypothetical protein
MLAKSSFLRGLGPPKVPGQKPWRATFNWLIRDDTIPLRVYEGAYA